VAPRLSSPKSLRLIRRPSVTAISGAMPEPQRNHSFAISEPDCPRTGGSKEQS